MVIGHRIRDLENPLQSGLTVGDCADYFTHLTPDHAVYRVMNTDHVWGVGEQLIAQIYDFMTYKAWVEGEKKGPKPEQIPRPGVASYDNRRVIKPQKPVKSSKVDDFIDKRRA